MAETTDTESFNPYLFDRPVPGAPPKHVFQAIGVTDNYVGLQSKGLVTIADSTFAYNQAEGLKTALSGKIKSFGNNREIGNGATSSNVVSVATK